MRQMNAEQGFKGFYRGVEANVLRAIVLNGTKMVGTSYLTFTCSNLCHTWHLLLYFPLLDFHCFSHSTLAIYLSCRIIKEAEFECALLFHFFYLNFSIYDLIHCTCRYIASNFNH
jgi:hypothetical protein